MSLQDWVKNAWLVPLKTSREEIQNLLGIVERDLRDSRAEGISNDWQFGDLQSPTMPRCRLRQLRSPRPGTERPETVTTTASFSH
jgi:hypothetical protein